MKSFNDLPYDIQYIIATQLDSTTLKNLANTCTSLHYIATILELEAGVSFDNSSNLSNSLPSSPHSPDSGSINTSANDFSTFDCELANYEYTPNWCTKPIKVFKEYAKDRDRPLYLNVHGEAILKKLQHH